MNKDGVHQAYRRAIQRAHARRYRLDTGPVRVKFGVWTEISNWLFQWETTLRTTRDRLVKECNNKEARKRHQRNRDRQISCRGR